jgi:hypothetical protein
MLKIPDGGLKDGHFAFTPEFCKRARLEQIHFPMAAA